MPPKTRYATSSIARPVGVINACERSGGRCRSREARSGQLLRERLRLLVCCRNSQFRLQIPNGLRAIARRSSLAATDRLVLDLGDDLDGDKDGPLLIED